MVEQQRQLSGRRGSGAARGHRHGRRYGASPRRRRRQRGRRCLRRGRRERGCTVKQ